MAYNGASLEDLRHAAQSTPIIKLVNGVIVKALKEGSSDIYIEPGQRHSTVSFQFGDELRSSLKFPSRTHALVATRIKTMGKLDISKTNAPQKGHTGIRVGGRNFDMQISTQPATYGEKVVIHLLDKSNTGLNPGVTQEAMKAADSPAKQHSTANGEKTILIVDDSTSVRQVVKFVLGKEGFKVLQAEDGQQAWNMIQRSRPDLVISDFEMPNMSGPELVKLIRQQRTYDDMPVVLLTSHKEEESEVLGLETGADDYIAKPVEPLKLQARVKKMLAMYERIRTSGNRSPQ